MDIQLADAVSEEIPSGLNDALSVRKKAELGHDHPMTRMTRAIHAGALGQKQLQQKKYAEAEPLLREEQSFREKDGPNYWSRFHITSLLGASLLGQKKFDTAESLLIEGYEGLKRLTAKFPAPHKRYLTEAGERVVRLYEEWGKPEKAAVWRAKLARELPAVNNEPKP